MTNAPGQIELALRNLVHKQTDLRVWRYWRTLNLLGNFDGNPDPLVRDNIMFSGFTGDQINLYEAATGSTISAPASSASSMKAAIAEPVPL